jgi:hypothetical protein
MAITSAGGVDLRLIIGHVIGNGPMKPTASKYQHNTSPKFRRRILEVLDSSCHVPQLKYSTVFWVQEPHFC